MEWSGAKKIVVVLLVVLNIVLAGLNFYQRSDSSMTGSQERAIFEVLSKNGITIYTELLTDVVPMYRLETGAPQFRKEVLEEIFFDGAKTVVTLGTDNYMYTGSDRILIIDGNKGELIFDDMATRADEITRQEAASLARSFLRKCEAEFGGYTESVVFDTEYGWMLVYCAEYRGTSVFSKYFTFYIGDDGIYRVDFSYYAIHGYGGDVQDVLACDEALLAFMRKWKECGNAERATIQNIEIGYELPLSEEAETGSVYYLEPHYRITLANEAEQYLVNGYSGQVVKKEWGRADLLDEAEE